MSSGAMQSKVGNPQVYNDGDQRNPPKAPNDPRAFHAGQANAHNNLDSKDERSLGNRLAAAEHDEQIGWGEQHKTVGDPLAPARNQGHEPSHGAKVDKDIQMEEEEYLRNKGKA